jgi:hypothetical protein
MTSNENFNTLAESYAVEFSACLGTILPGLPGKINDSETIHKGTPVKDAHNQA